MPPPSKIYCYINLASSLSPLPSCSPQDHSSTKLMDLYFPILVTYLCISVSKYHQPNKSNEIITAQLHYKNEKWVGRMLASYFYIVPRATEDVDGNTSILGGGYWVTRTSWDVGNGYAPTFQWVELWRLSYVSCVSCATWFQLNWSWVTVVCLCQGLISIAYCAWFNLSRAPFRANKIYEG